MDYEGGGYDSGSQLEINKGKKPNTEQNSYFLFFQCRWCLPRLITSLLLPGCGLGPVGWKPFNNLEQRLLRGVDAILGEARWCYCHGVVRWPDPV